MSAAGVDYTVQVPPGSRAGDTFAVTLPDPPAAAPRAPSPRAAPRALTPEPQRQSAPAAAPPRAGAPNALERVKAMEEILGVTLDSKGLLPRVKSLELLLLGEESSGKINDRLDELEQMV